MFDQSNIQSRPLVELFQKSALAVRTWLNDARAGMALADASLELVVLEGPAVSPDSALVDLALSDALLLPVIFDGADQGDGLSAGVSLSGGELQPVIFEADSPETDSVSVGCVLADADYRETVFAGQEPATQSMSASLALNGGIYEPA